jgi:hypothetical protein
MKVFDFVIVNFFTGKKEVIQLTLVEDLIEVTTHHLGEALPDCIVAGYLNGDLLIAHRPHNVVKEGGLVQEGKMDIFEFLQKWRMEITGEQSFPDFSLPGKKVKIKSSRGRRKPHRAMTTEIVPQAAGV